MPRIVAAWPAAVGEEVVRNAWPARIARDGTLHVHTSSSVWAFELGQLAPRILERLAAELGEHAPTALRFAPGHLPEAATGAPAGVVRRGTDAVPGSRSPRRHRWPPGSTTRSSASGSKGPPRWASRRASDNRPI